MEILILLLGVIIYLIGAIGLIFNEFRESVLWGLFGLLTQIGNFIFAIVHFDKCKKNLGFMLLGILLIYLGFALSAN